MPTGPSAVAELRTYLTSVRAVGDPSPGVRQITLAGGDLDGFEPVGPDTFVYLLLPPVGRTALTVDRSFTWERYGEMGDAERPVGAYYSVRRWRPGAAEIDLHVVLHPGPGPAATWAEGAVPGAEVAVWGPRTAWHPPEGTDRYVLVADDTALPATAAILESAPPEVAVTVVAETEGAHTRPPLPERPGAHVVWLDRGGDAGGGGDRLLGALRALEPPGPSAYVWGGGEARAMTTVRRHVRDVWDLPAEQVSLLPYWRAAASTDR